MKLLDLILEDVKIPFPNRKTIKIENEIGDIITVKCEIPKTDEEKSTGLIYRDSLCKNCGVFYDYIARGFWI